MGIFSQKIPATSITTNIERATAPDQQGEDWDLIIQICNSVNSYELGAKEARKLLQKRLVSAESVNTKVLALSILQALSENCGPKFQAQLGAKSFVEDLGNIAFSPSTDPLVHGKLISVLQSWSTQFQSQRDLAALSQLYTSVMEGAGRLAASPAPPGGGSRWPGQGGHRPQHVANDGFEQIPQAQTAEQRQMRIASDIEVAKNNAQILSQTLSFTDPEKEDISKNELIQEFYSKCKGLQQVIGQHLENATDSDLLATLIETNQELINVFKTYDDMLEHKDFARATKVSEKVNYRGTGGQMNEQSLIDFDSSITPAEGSSTISGTPDAFDPFSDDFQVSDRWQSERALGKQPANGHGSLPPPLIPSKSSVRANDDDLLL